MTLVADFNSSVNVPFQRMRALLSESGGGLQAGVIGANDLKVAQRGAGANMSVDVPTGAAWVAITSGTRNGLGHVYNDATANVTVTASNATNPRIDSIILRWNDSSIPTGSGNIPTLEVATGAATAGATLDNRTGAATPTGDFLRLADILVPATSTSVVTANIRDRRPWARGAFAEIIYTGGAQTLPTGAFATITTMSAAIQQRVECAGTPLIVEASGMRINTGATAGNYAGVLPAMDGALAAGGEDISQMTSAAVASAVTPTKRWRITPSAGSHLFTLWGFSAAASVTIVASATDPMRFMVWEDIRPVANNGTT